MSYQSLYCILVSALFPYMAYLLPLVIVLPCPEKSINVEQTKETDLLRQVN